MLSYSEGATAEKVIVPGAYWDSFYVLGTCMKQSNT